MGSLVVGIKNMIKSEQERIKSEILSKIKSIVESAINETVMPIL